MSDTKVTIKQVASAADVSVSTVSKVMNGVPSVNKVIARHVRETIDRLGYQPDERARALSLKRTKTIGVLAYSLTDPVLSEVVTGIQEESRELGYDMLLMQDQGGPQDELHLSRVLIGRRVDGVIIVGANPRLTDERVISLFEHKVPLLLVFRESSTPDIPSIYLDDFNGARLATAHLLEHGHRQIGTLATSENWHLVQQRMAGFLAALEEANIPFDKNLIEYGNWNADSGYDAMKRLLARARPTAIFAFNDRMACGAMHAIREVGLRIPEDIAIAGFDNVPSFVKYTSPPLTTVSVDYRSIGIQAANRLLATINGDRTADTAPFPTQLVIRQSCGCGLQ